MSEMGSWSPVPEDEKEEGLRAQQFEKWRVSLWEFYEHFHGKEPYFNHHGLEDFENGLAHALNNSPGDRSILSITFIAEVCRVHKSTVSRYLSTLQMRDRLASMGIENFDPEVSQNEILRIMRWSAELALTRMGIENKADLMKLDLLLEILPGERDRRVTGGSMLFSWLEMVLEEQKEAAI